MRIVLAHKYFFRGGGTATYLLSLMEELQKRGHECIPFTVAYDQTVPREYWEYYVSPPSGSEVTHLKDMRLSPWAKLKLLGRATWSTEAYHKALRLVDDLKPDIAYVHNLYSYMSPSPIAAFKKRGIPVVMRVADYNLVCPELHLCRSGQPCTECLNAGLSAGLRHRCHKGSFAATFARVCSMSIHNLIRAYEGVDLFVTPSSFMRTILVRAGYRADKIQHLPSFYAGATRDREGPAEGQHILYFGRLAREKRLDILVKAHCLIGGAPPLVLAGADVDGERDRLEDLARDCGTDVRFAGHQEREQLDDLIANALFAVVPSNWYDNCPMSVLETFAHGRPVIGADIGGIPEQVTADSGLLFRPGDAESLAEQMQTLLGDAGLRKRMGDAALERLQAVYDPGKHCEALLEHFDALVGRD